MIDELDLAFDEPADRGRHRHRRSAQANQKKNQKKRKRNKKKGSGVGRTLLALLLTFLLLGGLAGAAWWGFGKVQGLFNAPDYASSGTGDVVVQVKTGDTAADIANTLYTHGVVKSAGAFIEAAQADPRSKNIQPGFYHLHSRMSAKSALAMLLDLGNKMVNKVTIPEGRTAEQIYALLSKQTHIPVADFEKAAKDPSALGVPDFWFKRDDGKKVTKSIEGFLFPATYELDPGMNAEQILSAMVNKFLSVAEEMDFVNRVQSERKITPYEALIVASLAQAEAGVPEDLGKIARVAYNRLYSGKFPCGCLQFDVTTNYGLELAGKASKASKDLSDAELHDASNPYSTHVHPGLPPTPIDSPGKQALQAAMDPPAGNWLYFVAIDKQGHSAFATTYAEQLRNEAKARANGVL